MKGEKTVLYISYDGMTDNLGQSQVIPYLIELSHKGYNIHLLSAEKENNYAKRSDFIANLLSANNIHWHPVKYTKKPPVISTMKDIRVMKREAATLHRKYCFSLVHCRSYVAAFVGQFLKQKFGIKFIFDMRGFFADERVDGNLWRLSNPLYNAVYKYFKRKEKQFFSEADYTISLTYAGRDIIRSWKGFSNLPVEVIPCCADTHLFDYNNIDNEKLELLRKQFGFTNSDFVVTYLGSLGTWYMTDEMLYFFKLLKQHKPNAKLFFISHDKPELIYEQCSKYDIAVNDIVIKAVNREDVPLHVLLGNVSLFFIKPLFSKKASSPTKLAELLSLGMPVICNGNVGDLDKFMQEKPFGLITSKFDRASLEAIIARIDELGRYDKAYLRSISLELFSLQIGADRYYKVYKELIG